MLEELTAVLSAELPSQDDAVQLRDVLYSRCYVRSVRDGETARPPKADLTWALAAANRGRTQWVAGWVVEQALEDGRVVARKNGAERAFVPGEYITHRGPDLRPGKGQPITVYGPPGTSDLQESFYYAFGETVAEHEPQRLLRFYWNIRPLGAARLMESLTRELNRFQVPFRFKCLNCESLFPRRDAAVLYVDRRLYPIVAMLAEGVHAEVREWLNEGTPLFAKRLAHGLALAEDPGDSFGQHRCAILAEAMAASRGSSPEERLAETRRHFEQRGLSLDAPWLNENSADEYEFPLGAGGQGPGAGGQGRPSVASATSGEFLEIADRIGARLCRDALWSGGRCNWTGEFRDADSTAYGALGPQIYAGTAGVGLFLWRLGEATGDRIMRATAQGALRQAMSRMPQAGCGYYAGGLGIRFAAAEVLGEFDEEAALREAATDPERLDVIGGSAGCIGMLLALERRRGGRRWLEAAAAHGDFLMGEAARSDEGWSWNTASARRNLTGFSHGAAGMGWALVELWRATGEARFRAAGEEAFRYERSCFDPTARNWPDFREDAPVFPAVWCHGAGGIGFSRLRAWEILGENEALVEARTALATIAATLDGGGNSCLCHGLAGNADLLVYAAEVLREERWLASAREAGRRAAERYEKRTIPWPCGKTGNETPGLMTGIAGVGYFYLRLADAGVPTVLIPG